MDKNSSQIPLLTFNSLYNILRKEKQLKKLQELPEMFYEAVEEFLKNKNDEIKKLNENDKIKKQKNILNKSKQILKEIINIRSIKISNIAIKNELYGENTIPEENILKKEKIFFDNVQKGIKKLKKL